MEKRSDVIACTAVAPVKENIAKSEYMIIILLLFRLETTKTNIG